MSGDARLPELETRLQNRLQPGGKGLDLTSSEVDELLRGFRHGVMMRSTLAPRFKAFPAASYALALHFSQTEEPFWPAVEKHLLRGRRLDRANMRRAREELNTSVQKMGDKLPLGLRLAAEANGLHSFRMRPQNSPDKVHALVTWFGPSPRRMEFVFSNLSCPWKPPFKALTDFSEVTEEGTEYTLSVSLNEAPEAGHYEVFAVCPESGRVIENRDGQVALAEIALGSESELEAIFAAEGESARELSRTLERAVRSREQDRDLPRALAQAAANKDHFSLLGRVFLAGSQCPPGSYGGTLFEGLERVFRRFDLQQSLLEWAGHDAATIKQLAASDLPSNALPTSLLGGDAKAWIEHGRSCGALIALYDQGLEDSQRQDLFGDLLEGWGELPFDQARHLTVLVDSQEYRLVVEESDEGEISGTLTTEDEEEVEVVLKAADEGGYTLYPELARRSLFVCQGNILVADLRSEGSAREGEPVTQYNPVTVKLRRPRSRPDVKALTPGIVDARRLALATSRRISSTEVDQGIIQQLLNFDGAYTDPAAFGQAMLEWAIPLSTADDTWKKKLWAIDRESGALEQACAELKRKGLQRASRDAVVQLEQLVQHFQNKRAQPAALALEKAVLRVAVTTRTLARLSPSQVPDDIVESLANLEHLIADICPLLLRWMALTVELVLSEGGPRGDRASAD